MSKDNETEGYDFYKKCDQSDKDWFHRQWKEWPERVNQNNTTNISFLYGGIRAYREVHDTEPVLSKDLASCISFHDKYRKEEQHE